jgi:hypothetical protein
MNVDSDNQLITFVVDKCFWLIDMFEMDLKGNTAVGREWEASRNHSWDFFLLN